MFSFLIFLLIGILIGISIDRIKISFIDRFVTTLIQFLLFSLGLEVGINKNVFAHLYQVGFESFLIATASTLGSMIAARLLWKKESVPFQNQSNPSQFLHRFVQTLSNNATSLILILAFLMGVLMGYLELLPTIVLKFSFTTYLLPVLLIFVGFQMGHQKHLLIQFTKIPPRYLLLPFSSMLGTWLAICLIQFLSSRTLSQNLAISSGFGYYSLSSILISKHLGSELGTIALLTNIIRELYTLVFTPLMIRVFGPLAPIAAGGATTIDTTLPIISKHSNKNMIIIAMYSGFVLDFSVPFIVTIFSKLH